jgi:hypothetical protein
VQIPTEDVRQELGIGIFGLKDGVDYDDKATGGKRRVSQGKFWTYSSILSHYGTCPAEGLGRYIPWPRI